jgi:hypothetical protein
METVVVTAIPFEDRVTPIMTSAGKGRSRASDVVTVRVQHSSSTQQRPFGVIQIWVAVYSARIPGPTIIKGFSNPVRLRALDAVGTAAMPALQSSMTVLVPSGGIKAEAVTSDKLMVDRRLTFRPRLAWIRSLVARRLVRQSSPIGLPWSGGMEAEADASAKHLTVVRSIFRRMSRPLIAVAVRVWHSLQGVTQACGEISTRAAT